MPILRKETYSLFSGGIFSYNETPDITDLLFTKVSKNLKNHTVEERYKLLLGDCLDRMTEIADNYIDLIVVDLPYGTTQNKWDTIIPFDKLWGNFKRITKTNANIVFTASQPFTSLLVVSNLSMFKHEIIWQKTIGSGQLNIHHRPLKVHESILIFNREVGTYNEQFTKGEPYRINRKMNKYGITNYNGQKDHVSSNNGFRHPKSIITIPNPRIKNGHKTQKPLELMNYIIKTFSNKDDLVLDCCMGTGSTGISCLINNRKFIGIEKDNAFYNTASERMKYYEKNNKDMY
jgi:site-specific DNA-methyltransferase (adenine-specific)